jgi:hypothetical protein
LESIHASAKVVSSIKHDDLFDRNTCSICDSSDLFKAGGVGFLKGWEVDGLDDLGGDGPELDVG